jgi:hypothetical protein
MACKSTESTRVPSMSKTATWDIRNPRILQQRDRSENALGPARRPIGAFRRIGLSEIGGSKREAKFPKGHRCGSGWSSRTSKRIR